MRIAYILHILLPRHFTDTTEPQVTEGQIEVQGYGHDQACDPGHGHNKTCDPGHGHDQTCDPGHGHNQVILMTQPMVRSKLTRQHFSSGYKT